MKSSRRKFLGGVGLFGFALVVPGCGAAAVPTTATILLVAKRLYDQLSLLRDETTGHNEIVRAAIDAVRQELKPGSSSPNLDKVALDWESNWKQVHRQTEAIIDRFKAVESSSDKYWNEVESNKNGIKDSRLRSDEEKKNKAARVGWEKYYKNAKDKIELLERMQDTGDDLHKVMLGAALRRQLADYTSTLEQIAKDAETLFSALTELTDQGQLIIGQVSPTP